MKKTASQKIVYIVQELIRTEKSYIASLKEMIEQYKKPLSRIASSGFGAAHLTQSEISLVFNNIDILLGVNERLFKSLQQPGADMGQIFHQLSPYLKMYTAYFRRSSEAMDLVEKAMETRPAFKNFCYNQEKDLQNLLVKPAQRITQYRLFLCELLKRTPKDQDTTMLKKAVDAVTAVAQHCNQSLKRLKQLDEYEKLVSRFGEQLPFNPERSLMHSDSLNKVDPDEPTQLFLFSDALAYGHDEILDTGKTILDQVVCFPHVQTRKGAKPFSIEVLTPNETFSLLANTAAAQVVGNLVCKIRTQK